MKQRFQFLFSAASEMNSGGSGASASTDASQSVPTPTASTPDAGNPASTPAAAEVGTVQRIVGYLTDKAQLIKSRDEATQALQAVTVERDALKQELESIKQEKAKLEGELSQIQNALNAAEQSAKTVNAAAVSLVAEVGLPSATLPTAQEAPTDSIASLEKAHQSATCPMEKQKIALKIKELQRENSK